MPDPQLSPARSLVLRRSLIILLACSGLLLSGCAPGTDPVTTKESLTEVTEQPTSPETDDEFDAQLHPDPIVEPLDCTEVLVLTARGTGEPKKGQLLSPVARAISEARPGKVETVDVDYPADTDVQQGGAQGVRTVIDTLNVQAEACPKQQVVLLGYSQGALIVGDALAEAEVRLVGGTAGALTEAAAQQLTAVVLYGNPRFVGSEPYNTGSFDPALNGLLPRPVGSLSSFADRIADFCVAGDLVCQSSFEFDEEPHLDYYSNGMQKTGAAFAISQLTPIPDVIRPREETPRTSGDEN